MRRTGPDLLALPKPSAFDPVGNAQYRAEVSSDVKWRPVMGAQQSNPSLMLAFVGGAAFGAAFGFLKRMRRPR